VTGFIFWEYPGEYPGEATRGGAGARWTYRHPFDRRAGNTKGYYSAFPV